MSLSAETAPPVERYGVARRALLLVVGALMIITGLALMLVFVAFAVREAFDRLTAEAVFMLLFGTLVSGAFAAMGLKRVRAGVRGYREPPAAVPGRADSWYRRNWYAAGLAFWLIWVTAALFLRGPVAVFLRPDEVGARIGWYALLWYVLLPVHVALHELGHAVAAALLGFRFVSLRVGWLTVQRDASGYRWTWARPPLAGVLGLHSGFPDDPRLLRPRAAAWAAAGPLTTLGVALACRAGATAHGDPALGLATNIADQVLGVGYWLGLALAATSALPFRTAAGYLTDGGIVRLLLGPMSPATRCLHRFQSLWFQGRRPRDWGVPASEFLAAASEAAAERDSLLLAATCILLDTGDEAQASEIVARAVATPAAPASPMRFELELQAAMLAAFQGRAAEARERLARAGPHASLPGYPRLAEAVVDACDGNNEAAAVALAEWERTVEGTGRGAMIRVGNDWAVERLRPLLARRNG